MPSLNLSRFCWVNLGLLALFCSVKTGHIISAPDVKSVYELPLILEEQNFSTKIFKTLGLPTKPANLSEWKKLVKKIKSPKKKTATIAIVGKYFATGDYVLRDSYAALYDALDHASIHHDIKLEIIGINSEKIATVKKQINVILKSSIYYILIAINPLRFMTLVKNVIGKVK